MTWLDASIIAVILWLLIIVSCGAWLLLGSRAAVMKRRAKQARADIYPQW